MTSYVALFGDPVIGNPTSRMHNTAFHHSGLDWHYLDVRVVARDLADAMRAARVLRFAGLNITVPHKVAVLPLLDRLERTAALTGAVNTVVRSAAGDLLGHNTDGRGFIDSIVAAGIQPAGMHVVLLGAGGAARAVAIELALAGAQRITIASRTPAHGLAVARLVTDSTATVATMLRWDGVLQPPPCQLLVNCTPVGMGQGEAARAVPAVDLAVLAPDCVVCDLHPGRADTAFLQAARHHGLATLDGLSMLARQGAAGFELWTGVAAPLELMLGELGRIGDEADGQP